MCVLPASTKKVLFCSCALSTYKRKFARKMHHINLAKHSIRIRVKKFKQNLPENHSKSTKIAITACKFSKNFQGSMPPDPPRAFLVSQSAPNLLCRKKFTLEKNVEIMAPFLKFLATPLFSLYG